MQMLDKHRAVLQAGLLAKDCLYARFWASVCWILRPWLGEAQARGHSTVKDPLSRGAKRFNYLFLINGRRKAFEAHRSFVQSVLAAIL
jgi:hypothetical protein